MAVHTYDPAQVIIIMGGVPLQGIQAGSTPTLAFDEVAFTKVVDVDGVNVVRSKSNNRTATLTITLGSGSAANDFLSGLYQVDQASNSGVVPMMVKDNNGRTVAASTAAWVERLPSITGGAESEGREWIIALGQTEVFVGGAEGR